MVDFNLMSLANKDPKPKERPTDDISDARHKAMMDAIAPYAKPTAQKNLTPVYVDYKNRETSMMLVMCPKWSPYMPPFGLARLSGIAKAAGYETRIMDLNVKAYNAFTDDWWPHKFYPYRLWDPGSNWHWLGDNYMKDVHTILKPILNDAIDQIIETKTNVVCFTVYYPNEEPTKWMCQEIKRRDPNIIIAVSGPSVHRSWYEVQPYYDYVLVGDAEQNILVMLNEIEEGKRSTEPKILTQPDAKRVNLNSLPMPDYESIDFSLYEVPNGINSEISRGCTAKCTFCDETHFVKYTQRQAVDLITEVEWLYYNKGTDVIWFVDSLINGDINELRAFALALKEKELKVKFTGYARCDGRMNLEYLQDLANGGCIMLNFGCESGSQKVLDDMHKGVTIAEMEQNFIDCKTVGIYCATNWLVGYPTENYQDYSDTMTFMWRMRNMNINNMGLGLGFSVGPETIIGQNPHDYNVSWHKYQNHWISRDFTIGGAHVMTRVKNIHIWLDLFDGCTDEPIGYPVRYALRDTHYKITLNDDTVRKEMHYEKFDYNIIPPINDTNVFANSLVNEMWPFFRNLWRARGGYTAEVLFNPKIDLKEFGEQFGPGMYNAVYKFTISDEGIWEADFDIKFDQIDNPYDDRERPPVGRKGPFFAQDYSRLQSSNAKRARKLAKPTWDISEGRSGIEFNELFDEEEMLNNTIDFSFELHWKGNGDWSNIDDYRIDVSTNKRNDITAKKVKTTTLIDRNKK